jgi:hypothetical protein
METILMTMPKTRSAVAESCSSFSGGNGLMLLGLIFGLAFFRKRSFND